VGTFSNAGKAPKSHYVPGNIALTKYQPKRVNFTFKWTEYIIPTKSRRTHYATYFIPLLHFDMQTFVLCEICLGLPSSNLTMICFGLPLFLTGISSGESVYWWRFSGY